ncbi:hypothetical protein [Vibrio owensii]|uniref:hypothetical protein n=1 Tax=Vibrio owensii TaxID=696485 RepID=UPI003CC6A859
MDKPVWEIQAERGIELLQLCSDLQSEKDGVDRPDIDQIDLTKTLDPFAQDIQIAATNMLALKKLFPLMNDLSKIGRKLEQEGKIAVDFGDDYSVEAIKYLMNEHGLS